MARLTTKTDKDILKQTYDKQIYGVDTLRGAKSLECVKTLIDDLSKKEELLITKVFERLNYETSVHVLNVGAMAKYVTNDLGNDFESTYNMPPRDFIMSAILHDVGKCTTEDFVLDLNARFEANGLEKGHINKHSIDGPTVLNFIVNEINEEVGTNYHLCKMSPNDEKGFLTTKQIENIKFHHEGKIDLANEFLPKDISSINLLQELDTFQAIKSKRVYKDAIDTDMALKFFSSDIKEMVSFFKETNNNSKNKVTYKFGYIESTASELTNDENHPFNLTINQFHNIFEKDLVRSDENKKSLQSNFEFSLAKALENDFLQTDNYENVNYHGEDLIK